MIQGELANRIQDKVKANNGKVSFSFGIAPIIEEAKADFPYTYIQDILGKYEVSQTIRDEIQEEIEKFFSWRDRWFGIPESLQTIEAKETEKSQ